MKYVSLDIETTGLDVKQDVILQIAAIVEDTSNKLPREQCPCIDIYNNAERFAGNPYALGLNVYTFKKICELKKRQDTDGTNEFGNTFLLSENSIAIVLSTFLDKNGVSKPVFAGKNVASFDLAFLKELPDFSKWVKFHHRVLDPAMLYINFATDSFPPDMKLCKERAGIVGEVSHNALDDAWNVIELLRTKY